MRKQCFIPVSKALPAHIQLCDVLLKEDVTVWGETIPAHIRREYIFIINQQGDKFFQELCFWKNGLYEMRYDITENLISHWAPR